MTRLDRVLTLLNKYDSLVEVTLALPSDHEDKMVGLDLLASLRKEKEKLTQELIEHGCRRKN